jgi:hypothetical protein
MSGRARRSVSRKSARTTAKEAFLECSGMLQS